MIKIEVRCNTELVMTSIFDDATMTLERATATIAQYVTEERLNEDGEVTLRAVFCTPVAVAS